MTDGDLPSELTLHWGLADNGTDATAWENAAPVVIANALGVMNVTLQNLEPGTFYHARFSADNSQGTVWADNGVTFLTPGPPITTTGLPNDIDFNAVTLEGTLVATSGAPASVWIYWGSADGGTDTAAWQHAVPLGAQEPGPVSARITSLAADTIYFYRLYASNSLGGRWAPSSASFTTAFTPPFLKTSGLVLWLRADAGVAHSNGLVYAWADQATGLGGANNAAAAAGAACPTYMPGAIGGRAAIWFDGINDILTVADHDALDLGTGAGKGWTVLAVYLREKNGTQCIVSKGTAGSDSADWRLFSEAAGIIWGTGVATDANAWFRVTEPSANQPHLLAATLTQTGATEGTKVFYIDGVPHLSGTYAAKAPANTAPMVIGGFSQSNGNLQGLVAEVMVFNHTLNDDNLSNVGWYLQQKYGIDGQFQYRAPRGTTILIK